VRFNQFSAALDALAAPIKVFFRDDDAGWGDEQLRTLLDLFETQRAPIDLAVIPQALTREMALELCARRARGRDRLGLHQHGYTHSNHESAGRKCEFGLSRTAQQQAHDIQAGRLRLQALLGNIDPIFTPPWNRCSQATLHALRAAGLQMLSRDATAQPLDLEELSECPVHVDWCKWTQRDAPDWAALDQQLAAAVLRHEETLGIMLHHAVMGDSDWAALRQLLTLLNANCRVQLRLMRELVVHRNPTSGEHAVARV
jgi:predicted deacetylase